MKAAEIIQVLEQKFGDRIRAKKLDAIDPFVVVAPSDLLEVARFLRDDSRLRFDILNCMSGVDYLEPDAKKAPKAGFEPHG
jgi:NADH-quinone oxidoreductase subunit C